MNQIEAPSYDGQTVVITGGGSGLGRGMALSFAAAGAYVVVLGRRSEALAETVALVRSEGGDAAGYPVDVRDIENVKRVIGTVASARGINVLVNNAAGNFISRTESLSANGFKAVVDIALCGTFNCCRESFDALRLSKGSILNITAVYAQSGEPGVIHSAAAKAGVLALTRTMAAEWGRYGIRSNCIAPGPIHTDGADKNLWSVSGLLRSVEAAIPIGRLGLPEDISHAAVWLCSSQASWVNGADLVIDGGHRFAAGTLGFLEHGLQRGS